MKPIRFNHLPAAGLTALLLGLSLTQSQGQEDRPPPERWRALTGYLEKKASEMRQAGKPEEAENLMREAREVRQRGEESQRRARPDGGGEQQADRDAGRDQRPPGAGQPPAPTLDQLRAILKAEAAAGHEDAVNEIKKQIAEVERRGPQERQQPAPGAGNDAIGQRLQHLHEAIEHLRAAGFNEPADKLAEQASAIEQRMRAQNTDPAGPPPHPPAGARPGPGPGRGPGPAPDAAGLNELRREIQQLREQVEALSRRLGESPGNPR